MLNPVQLSVVLAYVGLLTFEYVAIQLSRSNGTEFAYSPAAAIFVVESLKLFISIILYKREEQTNPEFVPCKFSKVTWYFAVPAILYALQNNVMFYALLYVPAPTYSVFLNLRVVMTALVYLLVLGRVIKPNQWTAIGVIMVSVALTQLTPEFTVGIPFIGLCLVMVVCTLSVGNGVYSEMLLKTVDQSLHFQNMQLYIFGIIVNFMLFFVAEGSILNIFEGFTPLVWAIILCQASMGIVISAVMRLTDNIVKLFASAASLITSAILATFLISDFHISGLFFVGCVGIGAAIRLYIK
eukprot:TRINITY_DN1891_c0_g1_i1.p1 TRINITY_DN1891_c0_g1~~TRINITY_DN1891_c0_g1_i1.p1  ORF type:complete len:297 (-),score=37.02 TRINITY_DN1891_c0_g1_i1:14-904(-)